MCYSKIVAKIYVQKLTTDHVITQQLTMHTQLHIIKNVSSCNLISILKRISYQLLPLSLGAKGLFCFLLHLAFPFYSLNSPVVLPRKNLQLYLSRTEKDAFWFNSLIDTKSCKCDRCKILQVLLPKLYPNKYFLEGQMKPRQK